jgi:hypothetical protein
MNKMEMISDKRMFSYALRLEKQNFKKYGRSLSACGIMRAAHSFIQEIRGDYCIMNQGWREAMKQKALEQ